MYMSDVPVKAKITIKLESDVLFPVQKALRPETETPSSDRSNTDIKVEGNQLILFTDASDVSALRASLNSYLRWVDGIQGIMEGLE